MSTLCLHLKYMALNVILIQDFHESTNVEPYIRGLSLSGGFMPCNKVKANSATFVEIFMSCSTSPKSATFSILCSYITAISTTPNEEVIISHF